MKNTLIDKIIAIVIFLLILSFQSYFISYSYDGFAYSLANEKSEAKILSRNDTLLVYEFPVSQEKEVFTNVKDVSRTNQFDGYESGRIVQISYSKKDPSFVIFPGETEPSIWLFIIIIGLTTLIEIIIILVLLDKYQMKDLFGS